MHEEKYDHPTQKPVDLMRRPLLNHTKRGESVYEPFLGSGTTLAAAEVTERVCWGKAPRDCSRRRVRRFRRC
jgi:DNA modification methylase